MTFKEVIYDVRESLKLLSIDSDVTDRQIAFLIRVYRAVIIRQFITNNPGEHRDMLTQSLYMPVELVEAIRYPEYSSSEYTILSTELALPNIVGQQMYKEYEVRIDSLIGEEIEMVHKDRITHFKYAPKNFIYGYREDNGKLYLISDNILYKNLTRVIVTAILENPEDIININEDMDELVTYPITASLWVPTKDMVIQHIAKELTVPMDLINNQKDDQLSTGTQK